LSADWSLAYGRSGWVCPARHAPAGASPKALNPRGAGGQRPPVPLRSPDEKHKKAGEGGGGGAPPPPKFRYARRMKNYHWKTSTGPSSAGSFSPPSLGRGPRQPPLGSSCSPRTEYSSQPALPTAHRLLARLCPRLWGHLGTWHFRWRPPLRLAGGGRRLAHQAPLFQTPLFL